jgi:hypothetical protein
MQNIATSAQTHSDRLTISRLPPHSLELYSGETFIRKHPWFKRDIVARFPPGWPDQSGSLSLTEL